MISTLTIVTIIASVIFAIFGTAMAIIGYFLRKTMDELKEVQSLSIKTNGELAVLKNDHTNKHEAMSDKFDDLKKSIDTLTGEIKQLTAKIIR